MKLGALVVSGSVIISGSFAACSSKSSDSADPVGSGSAPKKGSAGGFSASLSADLNDGSGSSATPTGGSAAATGSASSGSGSTVAIGSGSTGVTGGGSTGSGTAIAGSGSAKGSAAGSGSGRGSAVAVATGSAVAVATGSATPLDTRPTNKGSNTSVVGPTRPADNRHHVTPAADLAAIKLDLEPNWDRDFDEAGTISFVLKVPSTNDTRLFSFKYGYDLTGAPSEREAYKKFLADQKVLAVTLDRQRGAAWYLEGTDGTGAPAFRYLVVYGGKRLVCGGVLYKDKEATALGPDLRDKVVAAAKKICETIQL